MLHVRNLTVRRGADFVLESLEFKIEQGTIVGLTGPNGGGKSTLFETLMEWWNPSQGTIQWDKKQTLAWLPQHQDLNLALPLTVIDFVRMGTWKQINGSISVEHILKELRLDPLQDKLISALSGGQWKRAQLARCLVQPADCYLLDEPFNHLDLELEACVGAWMKQQVQQEQKTFFIITHDWNAMDRYCDHVILLNKRIITQGTMKEISQVYLNWEGTEHHEWIHR